MQVNLSSTMWNTNQIIQILIDAMNYAMTEKLWYSIDKRLFSVEIHITPFVTSNLSMFIIHYWFIIPLIPNYSSNSSMFIIDTISLYIDCVELVDTRIESYSWWFFIVKIVPGKWSFQGWLLNRCQLFRHLVVEAKIVDCNDTFLNRYRIG